MEKAKKELDRIQDPIVRLCMGLGIEIIENNFRKIQSTYPQQKFIAILSFTAKLFGFSIYDLFFKEIETIKKEENGMNTKNIINKSIDYFFTFVRIAIIRNKNRDVLEFLRKTGANYLGLGTKLEVIDIENLYSNFKELGAGSFGQTFVAEDQNGKKVLIKKFFTVSDKPNRTYVKSYMYAIREYLVSERIGCDFKYISCTRQTSLDKDGSLIAVMEYFDGPDYYVYNKNGGKLTSQELIWTMYYLMRTLDYIHKKGIAHRDIKRENILKTRSGPILIDFGLSCFVRDRKPVDPLCISYQGTKDTMAPEVIRKEKNIDLYKTDIYSMGVTFSEMLKYTDINDTDFKKIKNIIDPMISQKPETRPVAAEVKNMIRPLLKRNPFL